MENVTFSAAALVAAQQLAIVREQKEAEAAKAPAQPPAQAQIAAIKVRVL